MKKENFVIAVEFCSGHNIDLSFLETLNKSGLIEFQNIEETIYIHENQLQELEKILIFYYDLDINLEGIETIIYLLHRSEDLQNEINNLRNRLRFYEDIP
jgi:hypothetical protein